jgi:hypothetical protein
LGIVLACAPVPIRLSAPTKIAYLKFMAFPLSDTDCSANSERPPTFLHSTSAPRFFNYAWLKVGYNEPESRLVRGSHDLGEKGLPILKKPFQAGERMFKRSLLGRPLRGVHASDTYALLLDAHLYSAYLFVDVLNELARGVVHRGLHPRCQRPPAISGSSRPQPSIILRPIKQREQQPGRAILLLARERPEILHHLFEQLGHYEIIPPTRLWYTDSGSSVSHTSATSGRWP